MFVGPSFGEVCKVAILSFRYPLIDHQQLAVRVRVLAGAASVGLACVLLSDWVDGSMGDLANPGLDAFAGEVGAVVLLATFDEDLVETRGLRAAAVFGGMDCAGCSVSEEDEASSGAAATSANTSRSAISQ
jgi:hypothetical protein